MTGPALRVLGEVSVQAAGRETVVAARRERSVLAVLIAAGGAPVTADHLVDGLWGGSPPAQAAASLQVAVSRLRTLLEPDRVPRTPARTLTSSAHGYRLVLPEDAVDARRFDRLATAAGDPSSQPPARLTLAEQALRLWRGRPYPGVEEMPGVREEVTRLEAVHLGLLEARAQALLDLGRHDVVAAELPAVAVRNPFRERVWALLALAQYRCDRQADALATLRQVRAALVDELGVDPSAAVRELEADVLAQSPRLAAVAPWPDPQVTGRSDSAPQAADPSPASAPDSARPCTTRPEVVTEGRQEALAAVSAAVAGLVAGAGGVLLLSGEPGIGKSVLADELAARAEEAGAHVLWGRCHEADVAPAYWPWLPVLRAVAGDDPGPGLAAVVAVTDQSAPAVDSSDLRTYDAASRALRRASAERPLLVVLEDVHWADTSSLRLLAYAAEALRDDPVLLALTRRTTDAPSPPALASTLAALSRLGATRVTLRGLAVGGIARLVEGVVGRSAPELSEVVAVRTDGNPFFVLELARLLHARGATDASDAARLDVPDGIRDVLRLRVERLSPPEQRLLAMASVAGREIDPGLVAAVLEQDVDELLDLLDSLVAAGVVQEQAGRYRFTHALTRETVYDGLPPSRRLRWHARTAEVLRSRLEADPELVADVAHHYAVAARSRPELVEPAVEHAQAAAALAAGRGAHDEACQLLRRALEVGDLVPSAPPERRLHLLVALASAQLLAVDVAGARDTVSEAVAAGREMGRWDLVAEAANSLRFSGVWHWREFGCSDDTMIEALHGCADHLPAGQAKARVLAALQTEYMYGWRVAEADRYGREAVELARSLGDPGTLVYAIRQRLLALWGPGGARERLALTQEALASCEDDTSRAFLLFELAHSHHQLGDPDRSDAAIEEAWRLAEQLRHTTADVPLAWWRYMRAHDRGQAGLAAEHAAAALELHRRTSMVGLADLTAMVAVRLAPEGAEVPADVVALARRNRNPALRALVAEAVASSGRLAEAVDLLGEATPPGARDYASLAADCLRAETLALAGRTDLLPGAAARLEPWLDEVATYGSVDSLGSVRYFAGHAAEVLGRPDVAREHYRRAVETDLRTRHVPWRLRAERRLARLEALDGSVGAGAAGPPGPPEEAPSGAGRSAASRA